MNMPLHANHGANSNHDAAANVARLHSPKEAEQIERAMERERNPGRTMLRSLVRNVQNAFAAFKTTDDPNVLFIDHKAENITNALAGLASFSGEIAFKTGLIISNEFKAPEGSLVLEGQTLIIEEGAEVVLQSIKCKTLINLGKFTVTNGGEVSGMLLSNDELAGDFRYGSLQLAAGFKGSLAPIAQTA
ncbi:hypothetical protein [Paraburkholderia youngii]|uniref:hypothetical protein n=1 Tax=Paraburkholderia youngii TaxID=2782701 RepID=UPI003D1C1B42